MLDIINLSFGYKREEKILKNVSFNFYDNKTNIILGKNGAGKTTLLKCLLNLIKTYNGMIKVDNKDVKTLKDKERAHYFSYVSQNISLNNLLVYDFLLLGRINTNEFKTTNEDKLMIDKMINEFDLNDVADKYFDELSSGQRQKIMICRSIISENRYLILDEPLSNLDIDSQYLIMNFLDKLKREKNITLIITMHDLSMAYKFADSLFLFKEGNLFFNGEKEKITEKILANIYDTKVKIIDDDDGKYIKI